MRIRVLILRLFCAVLFLFNASCDNQFSAFADTTSNLSLFYEALEFIRDNNFDGAVAACEAMEEDFLSGYDPTVVCASAFAGRCGFTVFDMASYIENYGTAAPPEKIFEWFLAQFTASTTAQIDDCSTAESIIRNYGPADVRDEDLNALMALINIHTIALIADETGDTDDDNSRDGGYDACATSAALSAQLGSAIWEFDKALDALSSNSFYSPLDAVMDFQCTALNLISKDVCAATDPESLSAAETQGAQSFLKEGSLFGLDQCGGDATVAVCNCP